MEFLGKGRDRASRQALANEVCQIVRVLDRLAEHFPSAEDLDNSFCFHCGLLAIYSTPFGQAKQQIENPSERGLPVRVKYECRFFCSRYHDYRSSAHPPHYSEGGETN